MHEEPLEKVKALADDQAAKKAQLQRTLIALGEKITEHLGDAEAFVSSDFTDLERYGDDGAWYGYLCYGHGSLHIAHRSTEEDFEDAFQFDGAMRPLPPPPQTFSLKNIDQCSFKWLLAVSQPKVIDSFFAKLVEHLESQRNQAESALSLLSNTLDTPLKTVEEALEQAAQEIELSTVVSEWRRAQSSLLLGDAPAAVTRSSSFVETVCKHILHEKKLPLPTDQSISPLMNLTLGALRISPDKTLTEDIRKMISGVKSILVGLGSLRTHGSMAHGHSPEQQRADQVHARLAVTTSAAVATFLMETLRNEKQASTPKDKGRIA